MRYKVVIIGDSNVGKTCIVNRVINDVFTGTESNVGALFFSKDVTISGEIMLKPEKIRLQIWDTAGGEQFRTLGGLYYRGASAILLVYDSTNAASFEGLDKWLNEVRAASVNPKVLVFLVASKVDLHDQEQVTLKKAGAFAKRINGFLHLTSAKEGTGIKELIQAMGEKLYQQTRSEELHESYRDAAQKQNVLLHSVRSNNGQNANQKKGCAC